MQTEPSSKSDHNSSENATLEVLPPNAIEAMSRGEIDCQIATAHKFPRSLDRFNKRAEGMATMDIETAESCLYCRPVGGGKNAEGMSVRMAEIVGACYGNLRVSAMLVEQTDRFVRARGMAHDLETNFASSSEVIESTVKKDGTPYDERMRIVIAKSALAKARRDATFQVVPRALARPIERAVQNLLNDEKVMTFNERRDAAVRWMESRKLEPKRVWSVLGVNGPADLQVEHLEMLTGLKTAIKDGEITIEEAFPLINAGATKPIFTKPPKAASSVDETKDTAAPASSKTVAENPEKEPIKQLNPEPPSETMQKVLEFQKTYGWTEEQFMAWLREEQILPARTKIAFADLSDNMLKLALDKIDKLNDKAGAP